MRRNRLGVLGVVFALGVRRRMGTGTDAPVRRYGHGGEWNTLTVKTDAASAPGGGARNRGPQAD